MTPSFVLSARAKRDLRKAKTESLKIWNIEQTNIYLASIESRLMWLAENPQLGKHRDEVREGLRSYTEGRHVIFYRIGTDTIETVGVPHQRQELNRYFEP
jgi:toxin ParE1/3/4